MISVNLILTFVIGVVTVLILIYLFTQKDRFQEYIKPLDKAEYSLKELIPLGLWLLGLLKHDYMGKYNMRLMRMIGFIYGLDYSLYYLQIHIANKIVYTIIVTIVCCIIGIFADVGYQYLVVLLTCPVCIFFLCDRLIHERGEERSNEIKKDFPDFVGKLTLLMGAGLNVRQSLEKIAKDSINKSLLHEEIIRIISDMQSGKSEIQAYRELAERTGVREINRLTGIIIQNITIGGSAILKELDRLCDECWNLRKLNAGRLIEQAETKLTFPMILMFLAVIFVIMLPAVMALKGL